jgi:hypothetical protein
MKGITSMRKQSLIRWCAAVAAALSFPAPAAWALGTGPQDAHASTGAQAPAAPVSFVVPVQPPVQMMQPFQGFGIATPGSGGGSVTINIFMSPGASGLGVTPVQPFLASPGGDQGADAMTGGDHQSDLFRTAPPQTIPIDDPRLAVTQIQYSPIDGQVVIEGDIILGTEEQLLQAAANRAVDRASEIDLTDVDAPEAVLAAVRRIAESPRPRDAGPDTEKLSRIAEVLNLAGQVAASSSDESAFPEIKGAYAALNDDTGTDRPRPAPMPNAPDAVQPPNQDMMQDAGFSAAFRFYWPNGEIPFEIDPSFPSPNRILLAIDHWNTRTSRIRLVQRPQANNQVDFVRFVSGGGCASFVGRQGGGQQVVLAPGCGVPQIIHEIGHVVGMFHEQSRNDRDQHLTVLLTNVPSDRRHNFNQYLSAGFDFGPFDFNSIMLYPPRSFSSTGQPSMTRVGDPNGFQDFGLFTPGVGGVTQGLSAGDIFAVDAIYNFFFP